jgi:hypothetical protein
MATNLLFFFLINFTYEIKSDFNCQVVLLVFVCNETKPDLNRQEPLFGPESICPEIKVPFLIK